MIYSAGRFGVSPWDNANELSEWKDPYAEWIWNTQNSQISAPSGKTTLSKTFKSLFPLGTIYAACDNQADIYINGIKVLSTYVGSTDPNKPLEWGWSHVAKKDIILTPINKIKVIADNWNNPDGTPSPAGLLLTLMSKPFDINIIRSDTSWNG